MSVPSTPRLLPPQEVKTTALDTSDLPGDSLASLPLTVPDMPDMELHSAFVVLSESMMQTATPRHAHQAVAMPRADKWIAAMNREKACHLKNGTFGEEWDEKTMKPVKVTPADWVFRIKHRGAPIDDAQLKPNQYKARVVIKGQFMKEGIDFNDICSSGQTRHASRCLQSQLSTAVRS